MQGTGTNPGALHHCAAAQSTFAGLPIYYFIHSENILTLSGFRLSTDLVDQGTTMIMPVLPRLWLCLTRCATAHDDPEGLRFENDVVIGYLVL